MANCNPHPFSIRIFVADGDPDGLRTVERSNWVGRALVFPRAALGQPSVAERAELTQAGVYLLLGPSESGDGERLYIGEADPIKPRLFAHHSGQQKDFWTQTICFVSMGQSLNKAHVQFLESNLIRLAQQAKRMPLEVENKKNETEPSLSEADQSDMKVFLAHMLGMLPVLGIHAFEQPPQIPFGSNEPSATPAVLICKSNNIKAYGFQTNQGFVVKANSQVKSEVGTSLNTNGVGKRKALIEMGVLQQQGDVYVFTQDYVFTSPSLASSIVLGRSSNGWVDWRDSQGRSRRDIQTQESA